MSQGAYKGAKLVAEYHPLENKYYYYTTDQINSTRIVTDDNGTVVYAPAYDPYGGVQQTWTNTFNPVLKFSGKERDSESNLDYFGARYYDHTLYRFLSVDPVIPASRALYNPQRWNLYGYCLNRPLNYVEKLGADAVNISLYIQRSYSEGNITHGKMYISIWFEHNSSVNYQFMISDTKEPNPPLIPEGEYIGIFDVSKSGYLGILLHQKNENGQLQPFKMSSGRLAAIHQGRVSQGCIVTDRDWVAQIVYFIYYCEIMIRHASQRSMTASQIFQVLWGFYGLDLLSLYFQYQWLFFGEQINVTVKNAK